MSSPEPITVQRDCDVIQIPSGEKSSLKKDQQVYLTQALGGSFTVMTDHGFMVRVNGEDADAIGKEVKDQATNDQDEPLEKRVYNQLKTCFDPEIPVNIVDLGLIYDCRIDPIQENDPSHNEVYIQMTLTAPGCGMGDWLKHDVETKVMSLPGIEKVNVELVWDPPWDYGKMSEAAKLSLGM